MVELYNTRRVGYIRSVPALGSFTTDFASIFLRPRSGASQKELTGVTTCCKRRKRGLRLDGSHCAMSCSSASQHVPAKGTDMASPCVSAEVTTAEKSTSSRWLMMHLLVLIGAPMVWVDSVVSTLIGDCVIGPGSHDMNTMHSPPRCDAAEIRPYYRESFLIGKLWRAEKLVGWCARIRQGALRSCYTLALFDGHDTISPMLDAIPRCCDSNRVSINQFSGDCDDLPCHRAWA
jgi:hypothetical protein